MRILMLTAYPPVLNVHGGGVRMFHNIQALSRRHHVRVISFIEKPEEREWFQPLEDLCETVSIVHRLPNLRPRFLSLAPFMMHEFDIPEMHRTVAHEMASNKVDVVQCEYLPMAQYRQKGVFNILTAHEALSANAHQAFVAEKNPVEKLRLYYQWMAMLRYEVQAARSFDRVVTMTDADAAYLRSYSPSANVRGIPIGVDPDYFAPLPENPNQPVEVLFMGNFRHAPNVDAVRFLNEHVVPNFPDLRFVVAGPNVPDWLRNGSGLHWLGYVPDTRALYKRPNTIVVAPLFSGTGQRVKLLEAFSMAIPVITTSIGAAGFPIEPGREAIVADTPKEFVEALRRVLRSQELRQHMGQHARKMILEHFSWQRLGDQFLELVEEVGAC